MELTPRKQIILAAIVKAHIATGEPISSKLLCELTDMGLSSATLRNEMSDLCELGYLEQPHTSAGRVPTALGYRLYVNGLLGKNGLSPDMKHAIDVLLDKVTDDPEKTPDLAGQVLSDLTGLPALSLTIPNGAAYVKRVELIPMGRRTLLIVLVTSDGVPRSRVCRSSFDLSAGLLSAADRLIAIEIVGSELTKFNQVFLQTLAAKAGDYALALMPLMSTLFVMVEAVCESQLSLRGESNLFSFYKKESDARRLMEFISRRDAILSIFSQVDDPVGVVFGGDTSIEALKPSTMVVAKFHQGDKGTGKIGVIGPTRMSYEDVIPSIAYFAERLGYIIDQALKDMED